MEIKKYKASKRPHSRIETEATKDHWGKQDSCEGYVKTYNGFVRVHSSRYTELETMKTYEFTTIYFIKNGFEFYITLKKYYRPRYLVTLANRFIKQAEEGSL